MPEPAAPWAEPVHQRLRAWRSGQPLIDTCRAQLYFPDPEAAAIAGHLAAAGEQPGVHVTVDGTPEEQP
jgi:hypothetical protein